MDHGLKRGKTYKVFLVEEDDDGRERVVRFLARDVTLETMPKYYGTFTSTTTSPIFGTNTPVEHEMEVTLKVVPSEKGTWYTIENFSEEDDEDA